MCILESNKYINKPIVIGLDSRVINAGRQELGGGQDNIQSHPAARQRRHLSNSKHPCSGILTSLMKGNKVHTQTIEDEPHLMDLGGLVLVKKEENF